MSEFKVGDKVTVDGAGPFHVERVSKHESYSSFCRVNTKEDFCGLSITVHSAHIQKIKEKKPQYDVIPPSYSCWESIDEGIEDNKAYLVMFENNSICTAARIQQDSDAVWVFVPGFRMMPEGVRPKYYLPDFKQNLTDKELRILQLEYELKKLKGS